MFGVGNCITDDIFQEDFQNSSSFFVNKSRDSLHSSSASQSTDSWFGDTLNVISQHLAMTFCSSYRVRKMSMATSGRVTWKTRKLHPEPHSSSCASSSSSASSPPPPPPPPAP